MFVVFKKTSRWFEYVCIKMWTCKIPARFHSLTEMSPDRNGPDWIGQTEKLRTHSTRLPHNNYGPPNPFQSLYPHWLIFVSEECSQYFVYPLHRIWAKSRHGLAVMNVQISLLYLYSAFRTRSFHHPPLLGIGLNVGGDIEPLIICKSNVDKAVICTSTSSHSRSLLALVCHRSKTERELISQFSIALPRIHLLWKEKKCQQGTSLATVQAETCAKFRLRAPMEGLCFRA